MAGRDGHRNREFPNAPSLSQEYAMIAMGKSESAPPDTAMEVLMGTLGFIISRKNPLPEDQANSLPAVWVRTLSRVEKMNAEPFNFGVEPFVNIMPPPEAGVAFSGMAPESIADPAIRAKYVAALEANAKYTREYSMRTTMKYQAPSYQNSMTLFLGNHYARFPQRLSELKNLLERHIKSQESMDRIWDGVIKQVPGGEFLARPVVGGPGINSVDGLTSGQRDLAYARARSAKGRVQPADKEGIPAARKPSTRTTVQATVATDQGSDPGLKIWLALAGVAAIAGWLLLRPRTRTSGR